MRLGVRWGGSAGYFQGVLGMSCTAGKHLKASRRGTIEVKLDFVYHRGPVKVGYLRVKHL